MTTTDPATSGTTTDAPKVSSSAPAKKPKIPREDDPRNPNKRLRALFDDGTFVALTADGDSGMLAGHGLIEGTHAVAFASDATVMGGAMGAEEAKVIAPVLARLQAEGMALTGPHSADTLFHPAARSRYDAAVCMYHDQALIPIKTIDFEGGVNVTLGLDFVRTSPDHGTAYNIAGQGVANPASLIAALRLARDMAETRSRR